MDTTQDTDHVSELATTDPAEAVEKAEALADALEKRLADEEQPEAPQA